MIDGRKVIGVCLTKINDHVRADRIARLHSAATDKGYKIIAFNSLLDFFNKHAYNISAKAVYDTINYDIIDALVVFTDYFYDKSIYEEIIERAKKHSIPVVAVSSEVSGCYSIINDYAESYKSVIRHIVCEHGITDTFFVGGRSEDDKETEIRLACYKEVLEENGIEFSEDNVGYGDYWNFPTYALVNELLQSRGKPPRAIICANDYMAMAVSEKLSEAGYRTPDDVAVTGFDGIAEAEYFNPRLTTCKEDTDELAELTIDIITKALNDNLPCGTYKLSHKPVIAASCGCTVEKQKEIEENIIYRMMREMENHEMFVYFCIEKMLSSDNMTEFFEMLASCIPPDTYLYIKKSFIESEIGHTFSSEKDDAHKEYLLITADDIYISSLDDLRTFDLAECIPDKQNWLRDNTAYISNSLYIDDNAFGFYSMKANNILESAHQFNRMCKATSLVFGTVLNRIKEKMTREAMNKMALTNSLTKLPNLKGATKWYEEYAAIPENHEKSLAISIYGIPKYKYIYENFGISDIEEAVCSTADWLRKANPKACFIAQINDSEFIIINYVNDSKEIADVINNATSVFFSEMEKYNSNSGKGYFLEVNCGCTVANPGWRENLESFIKLASNEMYLNRLKMGYIGEVIKEEVSATEHLAAFNILVENNLFHYHFQPIVDARSGEIYGYEALMRTDASIGMNPLQVLDTAKAYKRLYDIEKATMYNVMELFAKDYDKFGGRKLFINSIPGHFLRMGDIRNIGKLYGQFMKNFVFEITELNSITDAELEAMKSLGDNEEGNLIAIDDYGTGHSNIVNLIRYAPHIIKIDRFLISDIHKDINKQMFVKSTIEFARINHIKVLAEGVETSAELRTVIDFGVDYVQGYYTGRPAPQPVPEIASEVKQGILKRMEIYIA